MIRILLISDSHGAWPKDMEPYLDRIDEVWHAGDIGTQDFRNDLPEEVLFRAVYGNIDDHIVRATYPENLIWEIEGLKILMTHIAGYPNKYNGKAKGLISEHRPNLVITGHSHILKIIRDLDGHLHMNPGAIGYKGFHLKRTAIRFCIDQGMIKDVEVIDLGKRGKIQ